MNFKPLLAAVALATAASAQLSGSVGPTTPLSQKSHICNVLDYGGSIGSSDIGPAITSAFNVSIPRPSLQQTWLSVTRPLQNCVLKNSGSTLYVPAGTPTLT